MTKQQEEQITLQIENEMRKIRNDALVSGMKGAIGAVLGIINKNKSDEEKLKEIRSFCEKSLGN